jgi:hypothetical protein
MTFLHLGRLFATLAVLMAGIAAWLLLVPGRSPSQSPPDLGDETGPMTRMRLAGLSEDPGACQAALSRAGVAWRALPARSEPDSCAFGDGVTWTRGGARKAGYAPGSPALACPLAAGLAAWEWTVVQPAAAALLGATVSRIDHFGSFACRRIYGREAGNWSRHARAQAIDIAGFRLADGRRITVAADWQGDTPEARFLHRVRDDGCRIFGTILSPDYNAAHRDHLHLEQARRGWSLCR